MRVTLRVALASLLLAGLAASGASAQSGAPSAGPTLTLDEAVDIALRNNPDHQATVNDRRAQGAAVRAAYGGLLPTADASFSSTFRRQGTQPINGVTFGTSSDVYQSSYSIGLNYRLSRGTLLAPRVQNATLDAVEADVAGSRENLRAAVAQQYLNALQAAAQAALQDSLTASAEQQLALARAKLAAGSATSLDVSRAEVELGTQQVAALRARNNAEVEKLRLFQRMGVTQPANVRLTTELPPIQELPSLESLLDQARQQNPGLVAQRSRARVADLGVKTARSEYLPTLSLSTGIGGYTYQSSNVDGQISAARAGLLRQQASCFTTDSIRVGAGLPSIAGECAAMQFSDAQAAALRSANDKFPFNFTQNPLSFTAALSIPIFNGFQREQRVEEARAIQDDARFRVRAVELQLVADVTASYRTLETARAAVALQRQNVAKAREEVELAEARYKVGLSPFLDVTQAHASYERTATDLITALYDYHRALASLEAAVGRPLR